MQITSTGGVAVMAVLLAALAACSQEDMDKAKETASGAIDSAGAAMEDAMDSAGEVVEDAVDATAEMASDAADATMESPP